MTEDIAEAEKADFGCFRLTAVLVSSLSELNVQYAPLPFSIGGRGTRTKFLFRDRLCLTEFYKNIKLQKKCLTFHPTLAV